MKHTKMPWETDGERRITSPNRGTYYNQIGEVGTPGIHLAKVDTANRDFIVLAANSHDDLVAACEGLLRAHDSGDLEKAGLGYWVHDIRFAREQIAKAKAQKQDVAADSAHHGLTGE